MSTQSTRFSRLVANTPLQSLIFFKFMRKYGSFQPSLEFTVKQCRDLEVQFQCVYYTLFDKICENFEENKLRWKWFSREKQYTTVLKVTETF